jgi:hypothetical protein
MKNNNPIYKVSLLLLFLTCSLISTSQIYFSGNKYKLYTYKNSKSQLEDITKINLRKNTTTINSSFNFILNEKDSFIKITIIPESIDSILAEKNWDFKISNITIAPYSFFDGVENITSSVKMYEATCQCDESSFVFIRRPIDYKNPDEIMIMMFFVDNLSKNKVIYFENEY